PTTHPQKGPVTMSCDIIPVLLCCSGITLIVVECVLMYMEPAAVSELMRWITSRLKFATIIAFEPIGFEHGFGKVLATKFATTVSAVARRNDAAESTSALTQQLQRDGWPHVQA